VELIKVTSACCGTHQLPASAFFLTVYDGGNGDRLMFFCPRCKDEVGEWVNSLTGKTLVNLGVRSTTIVVPHEARERKGGPPITIEDVLDFIVDMHTMGAPA